VVALAEIVLAAAVVDACSLTAVLSLAVD